MPHRIEVGISESGLLKNSIIQDLNITSIEKVEVISVYTIEENTDSNLTSENLEFLGQEVFSDPITENYTVDKPLAGKFNGGIVEVGFKPGVTDNVGRTAKEAITDAINLEVMAVYASKQYLFYGVSLEEAEEIAGGLVANKLIERWDVLSGKNYEGFPTFIPKVKLTNEITVNEINLNVSDEELLKISKDNVLALNLEEMNAIRDHFKSKVEERKTLGLPSNPTDVELECLAQTWSEHCCHKIFNAKIDYNEDEKETEVINSIFKTYIKKATNDINSDYLVSVFKDDAGIIKFNEKYTFAFKVETHNSPSALDPYGGALTGIVGVNRDPAAAGKGFKLVFNTNVFCFESPYFSGQIPPRLFHPRRVLKGVHKGVIDGGNQSGIPTVNGCLYFDSRYLGKPLVFVGTGGIAPAEINGEPTHLQSPIPGDLAIMAGGRIGADGIHGATFSSMEINENSPATAVQIGAPIVQKKMLDLLLEARDEGLIHALTDNGAGGLSSSLGEMAKEIGIRIDLDNAPLKYPGLQPWEILVSEAQERMSCAIPENNLSRLQELAEKHSVEITVVGRFNDSKHFQLYYDNKCVGNLSMDFLHNGVPQKQMKGVWKKSTIKESMFEEPKDYNAFIKTMLGRLNICSKETILRQYDHEVQGKSIIKPFTGAENDGPSDAAIIRPTFESWEGMGVSHGMCPRYSDVDAYAMVANSVDEGVRNVVCVGANPDYMAGLDNFCWCMGFSKEDEIKYTGDLVRANKALYDTTTAYKIPLISGKDSMFNDYRIGDTKVSVPPTLLFSVIGKVDDVRKGITMDAKNIGDLVYVLGNTYNELGSSEYLDELKLKSSTIPQVKPQIAIIRYRKVHQAIQKGLIESCHDCSDGGLGISLAETAFAGSLGMEIDLKKVPYETSNQPIDHPRNDYLLFSESPSRLVITIKPENKESFEEIMGNSDYNCLGKVIEEKLIIKGLQGEEIINIESSKLKGAWQETLKPIYGGN